MTQLAVVGMACRLPGADTPDELLALLRSGTEGLTAIDSRTSGLRRVPGFVPVTGRLSDPTGFDPAHFAMAAAEADLTDPQHRVFLEVAVEALEDAGHAAGAARGVVGVYAGAAQPGYLMDNLGDRFHPRGGADPVTSLDLHTRNVADHLPQRVAYTLGLTGPTVAVGATCATSLVAIHLACQALLAGECDTALAGGVSLRLPQDEGYVAVPDGPFSPDGHTRSYGAGANGTVFTQGAGAVVLRRVSDAIADGDRIHAVVLGSAIGNDGADRVGYTAPSVAGQARVIAEALAVADLHPHQIGMIEGHGTGTALGDPIEVQALRQVFGTASEPWCRLGSLKSVVGHTDSAAGVAGFVKAVLCVREGRHLPTLHAEHPNPALPLTDSPFVLSTTDRPWSEPVRRAGISSFGIGGVNAHVVIEQPPTSAPDTDPTTNLTMHPPPRVRPLWTSAADQESAARLAETARSGYAAHPDPEGLISTLLHGRADLGWRVADTTAGDRLPAPVRAGDAQLVWAFPGGGAQHPGMARELAELWPVYRACVERLCTHLHRLTGDDPRAVLFGTPGVAAVRAGVAQPDALARAPRTGLPALFVAEVALARLLQAHGVRPDAVVGHSVGEYAAAVVAGVLTEQDACRLVAVRSVAMGRLTPGRMLAVPLGRREVESELRRRPGLDLAAVNSATACVVAGPNAAVEELRRDLLARGLDARLVGVDVAAHSRQVEPALTELRDAVAGMRPGRPTLPLVTTVTGRPLSDAEALDPQHWLTHLRSPVLFDDALRRAVGSSGDAVVLQVGPGASIATLAATHPGVRAAVTSAPAPEEDAPDAADAAYLSAVGTLWAHGIPVDRTALTPGLPRRITSTWPHRWNHTTHWIPPRLTPDPARSTSSPDAGATVDEEHPFQRPVWTSQDPATGTADLTGTTWAVLGDPDDRIAQVLTERGAEIVDQVQANGAIVLATGEVGDDLLTLAALASAWPEPAERRLLCVQIAGEQVLGIDPVDPAATAFTGAPRVFAQELPGTSWESLDAADRDSLPDAVAAALDAPAPTSHRAHRAGVLWERSWRARPELTGSGASPQGVVITGGLGQVGLALADRLLDRGTTVALIARRIDPADERVRRVERWRTEGRPVSLHRADVADPEELHTALSSAMTDLPAGPSALVHASVVVELAPFTELDAAQIASATRAKVAGSITLATALDRLERRPDQIVVMSSAAGTIGGFGLGAYVAASRFLDGMASRHRWRSLAWDRWRFGTAAEAQSVAEVTMRHALAATDALAALEQALTSEFPEGLTAVSPTELNTRSRSLNPLRRTAPATGQGPELSTPAESLVASVWERVLGRAVSDRDADFFTLGGHSLLATRVLGLLRDKHGVELRLRDLLVAPTVRALAELVSASRTSETALVALGRDPSEPFGLTRVQHAYWVGRDPAYPLGGVGCHFYLEYACPQLDLDRWRAAWHRVRERHPMLRARVVDGQQYATPIDDWRPPVHEMSHLATEAAARRLARLRADLSARVADPATGPLVTSEAVLLPGGEVRVLVSVDVLACDSASWMIVDRELARWYAEPDWQPEPLQVTFADCVAALERRADSAAYARDLAYWTGRDLPPAPDLGAVIQPGRPRFTRLSHRLPSAQWQRITQQAEERGLTPTAVVLAAYAHVLARWGATGHFSITTTVFDRPEIHPQVGRVVGEFSSMLIHEIDFREGHGFTEQAARVADRLVADLDHRLVGAIEVLTETAREHGTQQNVPVVFTGMLGLDRLDGQDAHDHAWLGDPVGGASQTPQVWLDHQAYEHRGDLVLQWDVSDALDLDRARAAFTDQVTLLDGLAGGAAWDEAALPHGTDGPDTDPQLGDTVRSVWAELLHRPQGEITDRVSFLALGGDSLLAVRMAARLRQLTGVSLPLTSVHAEVTVDDLVEMLAGLQRGDAASTTLVRRPDPSAAFPLLPLQQAYFVGQSDHGRASFDISYPTAHVTTDVALIGPDPEGLQERLRRAVDQVVAHQGMLRAEILPEGLQRIRPVGDPWTSAPVAVFDLRAAEDPEAELQQIRDRLTLTGPDPRHGSGIFVGVSLLPGDRGRLHVSSSLLIADGWSAALLDRELLTCLSDPAAALEPLAIDFGDYVTTLHQRGDSTERRRHWDWWCAQIPTMPAPPALPRVGEPADLEVARMGMHERRWAPDRWARLRRACAGHGITPASAILTAYALTLAERCGQRELLLNSLQHNREPLHPDVDRLIGGFSRTALLPLRLTGSTFAEIADEVHRTSTACTEHHLVSAVEVGREMGRRTGRHDAQAPVIFQSTLGMDAALGGDLPTGGGPLGTLDISDYVQQVRTPQVHLELRVFELTDTLVLSLALVSELFPADLPDHILDAVSDRLESLLADTGWAARIELPDTADTAGRQTLTPARPEAADETPGELDADLIAALTTAWIDILELDQAPGTEDDFFAAGGDSLLAVRLLGLVGRRIGQRPDARTFLSQPTMRGMAAALAAEGAATPTSDPTAGIAADEVALDLKNGTGRPVFLLHPSGGDVLCYVELARLLHSDRPVVALTDPGLAGHRLPATIDVLVGLYLRVIRARQPEGRYTLAGWSMGGTMAHEVARRLRATGAEVDLVFLIDANSPERIVALQGLDADTSRATQRLRHLRSVEAYLGLDLGRHEDPDTLQAALIEAGALGGAEAIRQRQEVFLRHLEALAEHHAGPLAGVPVVLVRADEISPRNSGEGMGVDDVPGDRLLGWDRWTDDLTVHGLPGHHYALLRAPLVTRVAALLDAALAKSATTPHREQGDR